MSPTDILAEVDHRSTTSVGNRLGVVPREVTLVEHERAERELGRELSEKGGQFGDVVGASIRDVGGEEERELGSGGDERMEFDEDMAQLGREASGHPLFVASGSEAGPIPGEILCGSAEFRGQVPNELFEVGSGDTWNEGGDGRSRRDPMESHPTGELGQGSQRGVGLVIRPSFEGTEEEEAHDVPGGGWGVGREFLGVGPNTAGEGDERGLRVGGGHPPTRCAGSDGSEPNRCADDAGGPMGISFGRCLGSPGPKGPLRGGWRTQPLCRGGPLFIE